MNRQPAINLPPVLLWLAVLLVAAHAGRSLLAADTDDWILLAFGFLPARYDRELAAMLPGGVAACFWTPLTHAFLHVDIVHLTMNLLGMVVFGTPLARRFGSMRFLALSAIAAVAGVGFHYLVLPGDESLTIGASGAVSGMTGATARFAFSPGGPLMRGSAPPNYNLPAEPLLAVLFNSRALIFIIAWFGLNFVSGITGGLGAGGIIAWQAHIGGFLAGLLLFSMLDPVPRERDPLAS